MTENFLQKLEDKVTLILTQLETTRTETNTLKLENASLKAEASHAANKLRDLISLVDVVVGEELAVSA